MDSNIATVESADDVSMSYKFLVMGNDIMCLFYWLPESFLDIPDSVKISFIVYEGEPYLQFLPNVFIALRGGIFDALSRADTIMFGVSTAMEYSVNYVGSVANDKFVVGEAAGWLKYYSGQ